MSFQVSNEQKKKDKELAKVDPVNNVAKPITQDEDFCAELATGVMDFTKLKDEQFIVAVSTGDRNKPKLLASTIRGPYTFCDMVEEVGRMWEDHTHHAKVFTLSTDQKKPVMFLDAGTIDYIEAYFKDILFNHIIEAELIEDEVIIEAGVIGAEEQ